MRFNIVHKWIAVAIAGIFSAAVILCCTNHAAVSGGSSQSKHACCASQKKQNSPAGTTDCTSCPIVQKSVDVGTVFTLPAPTATFNIFHDMYQAPFRPVHTAAPVFLHGPPGPVMVVPLYIKIHSLRL